MRPPARSQSALRAPLNDVLGAPANVRLLRVLVVVDAALNAEELAARTDLNPAGVRRALARLRELGIIETIGAGRPVHRLTARHPLAAPLRTLFEAERARFDDLVSRLEAAVAAAEPAPRAAWLQGAVAVGADQPGDSLTVGALAGVRDVTVAREGLRRALEHAARTEDLTIEVRVYTEADLATLPDDERAIVQSGIALIGLPPSALLRSPHGRGGGRRLSKTASLRSHADADARALAIAAAVAAKLERNSATLIDRARRFIASRLRTASPGERRELEEWEEILRTTTPLRLRRLLLDRGERATRLRQTFPFLDALTEAERAAALTAVASRRSGGA